MQKGRLDSLSDRLQVLAPELRRTLAPPAPPLPTGLAPLDALLEGGVPRGRVTEIAGRRSAGRATVALTAAAQATGRGQLVAWIDARRELYPPSAAALGVDLARLLVVRPTAKGAARAAEITSKSRAFPLVVVDLADGEMIGEPAVARLVGNGAAVMVLAARVGQVTRAAVRLEVARRAGAWTATLAKGGPPTTVTLADEIS